MLRVVSGRASLLALVAIVSISGLFWAPLPAAASAGLQVLVQSWDPKNPDVHPVNSVFDDPVFFDKAVNQVWGLARGPICTQLEKDLGQPNLMGNGFTLYNMDCTLAKSVDVSIVGPASKSKVSMQLFGTGNEFDATSTQPTIFGSSFDPQFAVTFDLTATIALVPLPQPNATSITVKVSNAKIQTKNTIADIIKAFVGGGFITQAENSIDTTKKLDPALLNSFLAGVQTPLSQASQFNYVELWHHNNRIVVDLAQDLADQPRPASISGVITWSKTGGVQISDCSKIQFGDVVQLGPAPLTLPYTTFGAAPTDSLDTVSVTGGPPTDMGDHYQCQYTYPQVPLTIPNSFTGAAQGKAGNGNGPLQLSWLKVQPVGWNGTVNLAGDQGGLNFQILAATAYLPYNAATRPIKYINSGDPLTKTQPGSQVTNVSRSSTLALVPAVQLIGDGQRLMSAGNLNGAADKFSSALKLEPNNQVALLNLGQVHLKQGLTALGKSELQRALQLAKLHNDAATVQAAQATLRTIGGNGGAAINGANLQG